ncbi:MAG: HAMP domain-containing sensor histidine kinase [Acidobacteriota bacterium]|nr:HAMP domain-containing sensor histidine kinase [Acidobacteriota bacterium]
MERKLRVQLTAAVAASLLTMLAFIIVSSTFIRSQQLDATSDSILDVVLDYDGTIPSGYVDAPDDRDVSANDVFGAQFFVVSLDAMGRTTAVNLDGTSLLDEERAVTLAQGVYEWSGRDAGSVGSYRYRIRHFPDGSMKVAFLDLTIQRGSFRYSVLAITWISLAVTAGATLVFALLSKRIVAPIVRAQAAQRQFVIDAGHDLRTPVSIISADADVLAMDIGGDNEWLVDIKRQVSVMSDLTESLIALSRAATSITRDDEVEMGGLVRDQLSSFRSRALLEGHELLERRMDEAWVRGNRQYLSRMVGALLDNALKHSSPGAPIAVTVERRVRQVEVSVSNASDGVDPSEVGRWFDRFYQSDKSRAHHTGGFGIGLAMVRAVAEAHGGKARAVASDKGGTVTMTVTLPLPMRKGGRS